MVLESSWIDELPMSKFEVEKEQELIEEHKGSSKERIVEAEIKDDDTCLKGILSYHFCATLAIISDILCF